jgi:toxin ParE1/3/4
VKPVRYLKHARAELLAQVSHYENLEAGLGLKFWNAVEAVMVLASTFPKSGSPSLRGTRKVFTRGFPFAVVYFEVELELRVIAVAHFKRKPNYWKARGVEN